MNTLIETSKDIFQNILTKLIMDAYLTHIASNSKYDIIIQEMCKREWREECKSIINHIMDQIERLGKFLESPTLTENDIGNLHLEICDLDAKIYRLPADIYSLIPIKTWKR